MTHLSQYGADVRPLKLGLAHALFAMWLLLGGCSASLGEDAASCSGKLDNDGDGLTGCADSDCHRFELCRQASSPLRPDAGTAGSSGGQGGSAGISPTGGSGGSRPPTGGQGGSGGRAGADDAGPEQDASTCDCEPDEMCVDDACVPIKKPDSLYTVRILSAESPRGTFGPPPDGLCVEFACRSGGGSPVSYCPCEPELYVRVILIEDPAQPDPVESVVLTTQSQPEGLTATFNADQKAEVTLKRGNALRFELWDQNMTVADSWIYSCMPDLRDLTPGPLDCSAFSGPANLQEFWIRGALEKP